MTTITILADYADTAREKLTKLQRKAAGYGQTISFKFGEPHGVERKVVSFLGEKVTYTDWFIDIEVEGEAPRIGEHKLMARLTREAGGVIVDAVPGTTESVGEIGRAWAGTCDHCGHDRQRAHGFVVEENGKMVIVGRTCLRDYLGIDTPEKALWMFQFARDLSKGGDDEDGWGGFGGRSWHQITRELLAATSAAVDLWGWRPVSGGERSEATVSRVTTLHLNPHYMSDTQKRWKQELQEELRTNLDKHYTRAESVILWGREELEPGRSDYLHNLKLFLSQDSVNEKRTGYVCSAVPAYERAMGKKLEAEREAKANPVLPSNYLGQKGERLTVDAKVEAIIGLGGNQWGDLSIYKFRMENGNVLSWITSPYAAAVEGVGRGDSVKLTGTVKDHKEFKGVKETCLNRCKIEKQMIPA